MNTVKRQGRLGIGFMAGMLAVQNLFGFRTDLGPVKEYDPQKISGWKGGNTGRVAKGTKPRRFGKGHRRTYTLGKSWDRG